MSALPRRGVLVAWLAVFSALFFLELPGSFLLEPDEARYAEIPREMLATGNWLVPKLNFVDYFEKPPLLYWANAVSFRVFGLNPYAARLPCRLATLGVILLLVLGVRPRFGDRAALASGLIFLAAPLAASLGRMNLTDGLLTFTMTVALIALHEFLTSREEGKSGRGAAALVGLGCGLSVLTKGLVGIVLPGGALLLWCAISGRWKRIPEILFSWAPPVCLALTVPYFWAVEKAAPGFSRFFWIHEHFLRYATPEASRGGPIYYFVLTLFAGFIPWSFFLPGVFARIARSRRAGPEDLSELWFASWAAVILVFFSLSHSKLVPYIFPAAPALAVLIARRLQSGPSPRRGLIANAAFWTAAMTVGLWLGSRSGDLSRLGVTALAAGAAAGSVAIFWIAALVARRNPAGSIAWLPAGWATVYAAAILALPSFAADQSAQKLAVAARNAAQDAARNAAQDAAQNAAQNAARNAVQDVAGNAAGSGASVVSYRTYLQGFPWVLHRRIPIYGWKNELEFGSGRGDQSAFFPPRENFWKDWDSGRKIVALLRKRDRREMEGHRGDLVAENRKYVVVKNF